MSSRVYELSISPGPYTPWTMAERIVNTQRKPSDTQCKPYSTGLHWGSCWVCQTSHWVCQPFWIPTYWYRHRKSLALGVLPNPKPLREGFHVVVQYRIKVRDKWMNVISEISFPKYFSMIHSIEMKMEFSLNSRTDNQHAGNAVF